MIEIPPPVSKVPKPHWTKVPVLPFGHRLLNDIDPEREILSVEQQQQVLACDSEDAVRQLLFMHLDEPLVPNFDTAHRIFGKMIQLNLEPDKIIGTWRLFTLAQAMRCIDEGYKLIRDNTLSPQEKIDAHKSVAEAISEMGKMLDKMQRFLKQNGMIKSGKKDRSKKVAKSGPTKAPPSF